MEGTKKKLCPACGKEVIPLKKEICVRKGNIVSFYQTVEVCPNRKCQEIINR